MSTNTPDFNDKLAKVMANTAVATKEEASRALEESGGSVSGAITL
jgi:NACalpha-BTF3-like transcription factor